MSFARGIYDAGVWFANDNKAYFYGTQRLCHILSLAMGGAPYRPYNQTHRLRTYKKIIPPMGLKSDYWRGYFEAKSRFTVRYLRTGLYEARWTIRKPNGLFLSYLEDKLGADIVENSKGNVVFRGLKRTHALERALYAGMLRWQWYEKYPEYPFCELEEADKGE